MIPLADRIQVELRRSGFRVSSRGKASGAKRPWQAKAARKGRDGVTTTYIFDGDTPTEAWTELYEALLEYRQIKPLRD